jgi:5'-phosphate synthase pdxT subunit
MRSISGDIRRLTTLDEAELFVAAKELQAPYDIVRQVARAGKLPVPLFSAGGVATPADAALMMQLGAEAVFVGSGIFKSQDPAGPRRRGGRGHDPLQGSRAHRRGVRGPGRRHGLARVAQARAAAAARHARLVADGPGEPPGAPAAPPDAPLVGVLALQGGYAAHARVLSELGAQVREVRVPADPRRARRPRHPGGESTTMTLGIRREGLEGPLRDFAAAGRPVLGTCAGLIMLDRDHLGVMDTVRRRNAFGRQVHSSRPTCRSPPGGRPVHAVFIRAPWIAEHGPDVEVLAEVDGHPVAARQGELLVLSFHPELGTTRACTRRS